MYNINVNAGAANYTVTNLGPQGSTACIEVNGQGEIHFNDVGNKALGPNKQTWGVCITFRDQVWVFRYEGLGELGISAVDGTLVFKLVNGTIAELTK